MGRVAQRFRFLQAHDLVTGEAGELDRKIEKQRGYRAQVGRIGIEIGGADYHVFGVWRFHDQEAARFQHAQGLGDQFLHRLKRNVFDQMKCRHQSQAGIGLGTQCRQGVAVRGVQPALPAGGEHAVVEVDAMCGDPPFAQQFEPFAAAAAEVECVAREGDGGQRCQERNVSSQARLDQFTRTAVAVFEGAIKVSHLTTSTVGSSQLVPTKVLRFMFMTMNREARSRHS